jgi:dolichyl-phosphate-mannose--protein O-mannosyl transferase
MLFIVGLILALIFYYLWGVIDLKYPPSIDKSNNVFYKILLTLLFFPVAIFIVAFVCILMKTGGSK